MMSLFPKMHKEIDILIVLHIIAAINIQVNANDIYITLPRKIKHDATSIANCIKDIIDNYCDTVVITVNTTDDDNNQFINEMIQSCAGIEIPLIVTNESELKRNNFDRKPLYVLFLNNCEDILSFDWTSFEIKIKHLIITSISCKGVIKAIGEEIDTLDVTFILIDNSQRYGLITFVPQMTAKTCEVNTKADPIQIDTCYNSSIIGKENVFPKKNAVNLQGCTLKIGLQLVPPYATVPTVYDAHNASGYDELENVHGSDVELLKIIAKQVNASLKFHLLTAYERFDNICLNFLKNNSLDLCAGGMASYAIEYNHVAYTETYNTHNVIWVYSARRTHRYWPRIKSRIKVLCPFLLFYLCYCFLYNLISFNEGQNMTFRDTLFYSWGAFLGATALPRHTSWKHAVLNIFFLISSFQILILMTNQITSLLTIELPPKIYKTHEEMGSSGLKLFLNPTWNYNRSKVIKELAKTSSDCYETWECLTKASEHEGMTVVSEGEFKLFQVETAVQFEARVLKVPERIHMRSIVMIMRKNLHIFEKVHKLVKDVFESGIYQKLYSNEEGLNIFGKSEKLSKNVRMSDYSCKVGCRVKLEKMMPLIYIWMLGCMSALFVFILEVLSK